MADIGKISNKLVVDGQMYGGIAQGIGLALSEDFEEIEKHSTMLGGALVTKPDAALHYIGQGSSLHGVPGIKRVTLVKDR